MRVRASLSGLLLLAACGAHRGAARLEGQYSLGDPGAGWTRVRPGGADQAWHNSKLGATIYADSNCGERFDDSPLGRLHESLVGGVAGKPEREETRTLDGREALLRVVDGRVDGVPIRVGAVVLKKDACTYDMVYIASPERFDEGMDAFERVLSAFQAKGAE